MSDDAKRINEMFSTDAPDEEFTPPGIQPTTLSKPRLAGTAESVAPAVAPTSQAEIQIAATADSPSFATAKERARKIREERESGLRQRMLGGFVRKLDLHGEVPGYHLAIINDDGNRINECREHGYEFVQAQELATNGNVTTNNIDMGNAIKFHVGVKKSGEPMFAYAMKIPQEIWEEDEAIRALAPDAIDQQLQSGKPPGMSNDDLEMMTPHRTIPNKVFGVQPKLYKPGVANGS